VKSYNYSSVLLRFAKGNVRIKGKGGYLAYEGNVEKGRVTGQGKLYDHDEQLLYEGEFNYNAFNGRGKLYYPSGILKYDGSFADNTFEGDGAEYRENGSLLYRGEFKNGLKDGTGTLYDTSGSQIYVGDFQADNLLYSSFIGRTTQEIASIYSGKRLLYEGEDFFNVYLKDIGAIYEGVTNEDALDDSIKVRSIYVLDDCFKTSKGELSTKTDLRNYFGDPLYAGDSIMTQSEAIAISELRKKSGDNYFDNPELVTETLYEDDLMITSYNPDMLVYIESYMYGGLEYTFVSKGVSEENFGFYYISE